MEELSPAVQLIIPISGAVAAGLLALLGGWLGSRWGKKTEHEQWLRNEKKQVYIASLRALDEVRLLARDMRMAQSSEITETWLDFVPSLFVLAPPSAAERYKAYEEAVRQLLKAAASHAPGRASDEEWQRLDNAALVAREGYVEVIREDLRT